jgi:four helix bundle protein
LLAPLLRSQQKPERENSMSDFRTLNLAIEFHDRAERLKIRGHLRDQLIRASSSIALNLSEGNAKGSAKEKRRYYQTAYASLKECQTILLLTKSTDIELDKFAHHLGGSLWKLMHSKLKGYEKKDSF